MTSTNTENWKEFYLIHYPIITEKENIQDNKRVILIADDSPVITKFFTRTFKDEFEILVAKDGNEAIELVEENKDSLLGVFLDLQMPKKNLNYTDLNLKH